NLVPTGFMTNIIKENPMNVDKKIISKHIPRINKTARYPPFSIMSPGEINEINIPRTVIKPQKIRINIKIEAIFCL
ncbi:MAG TPA: hypothetical protein VMZ91_11805, partial [Candidatus Paceibacterota bacterium]|nr:hypothetical protein [Candidatus Paceibacterota bacterium]